MWRRMPDGFAWMTHKKVLIADDSPTVIKMLTFMLSSLPCEVIAAMDGVEAIKLVYSAHPDLILLDILMPNMNGYQVCRLLKDDEDTRSIPIIMLTAKDQQSDRFWGLATGADEYIVKDFEDQELLQTILRFLERQTPHPDRPETRKNKAITTTDVLSHANHLLDRQLYQSTITNRINQLARSIQNFDETLRSMFELLSRILTYQIGAIVIVGSQAMPVRLYVYLADHVSTEMFEQMRQHALNRFAPLSLAKEVLPTILHGTVSPDMVGTVLSLDEQHLIGRNKEIGLLLLGDSRKDKFSEEDRDTLRNFSSEIAVVIDNARLYETNASISADLERELRRTSDIQKSMLPQQNPLASVLTIEATTRPAKVVGGDYYDYWALDDHHLLFAIGDVTGKGASAALMMAMVKTALQIRIETTQHLSEIMALLNRLVYDQALRSQQYMTLFLGIIDIQAHTLTYCNAGHNFPYVLSPTRTLTQLEKTALPLGFLLSDPYPVATYRLQPDDIVFCYTDGIIEVMNTHREIFGFPRLETILLEHCQSSLPTIHTSVLNAIEAFCQNTPQEDDMTMLLVREIRQNRPTI